MNARYLSQKLNEFMKKNQYILLIMLFSAIIRAFMADQAFGGIHAWNEAHYAVMARHYFNNSLVTPLWAWGDKCFWVTPLFSYLVFFSYKIFGISELSARLVPIFFSVLTIYFVYKIGSMLYNEKVGLLASAFLSVNSMHVIFGRNVQTDAVFLFFILAALYFYLKALKEDKTIYIIIAGILGGLGFFTKQPAILIIPIIFLVEIYSEKRLNKDMIKRLSIFSFLTVIISLPWILWHLTHNYEIFMDMFDGESTRKGFFTIKSMAEFFYPNFTSYMWIFVILGVIYGAIKRNLHNIAMLSWIGVFFIFVLAAHAHEYYSLPLIPIILILASSFIVEITKPDKDKIRKTIFAFLIIFLLLNSFSFTWTRLVNQKYGYEQHKNLSEYINQDSNDNIVLPDFRIPYHYYYNINSPPHISHPRDDIIKDIEKYRQNKTVYLVLDPNHIKYPDTKAYYDLRNYGEYYGNDSKIIHREKYNKLLNKTLTPVYIVYKFDQLD